MAELGHQIQSPCSLLKRRRTEDVPLPTADEIGRLYHSLLNSNPITITSQIQRPCSLILKRKRTEDEEIGMLQPLVAKRVPPSSHQRLSGWQNTEEEEFNWEDMRRPPIPSTPLSAYRNHIHQESQYPNYRHIPQVGHQQNALPSATAFVLNQPHSFPIKNIPNNAFRGAAPSQNTGSLVSNQPGTVFSGLIDSLMSQGLIFLPKEAPARVSIAMTEFNGYLLKVRHDSVINALYGHLPRQCTTCGLRFKCIEEHSNHMDWHVTKNRASRNRKQKSSRKWYVTASMWVSAAEAVGKGAAYFPVETMEEHKTNDKDMAVAADEDQKNCALCGEAFDDFYSDETEEWMYKGAVYMNGSAAAAGMDRSQLGPLVHAKCTSTASP